VALLQLSDQEGTFAEVCVLTGFSACSWRCNLGSVHAWREGLGKHIM
jgi:hypothetical protein